MSEFPLEVELHLKKFKLRPYQIPLLDALERKGFRRAIAIWPRRAGKDLCAFNYVIRCAMRKVGVYFIVYPTYSQGRKILWDSMTNEGVSFRSFIAPEIIESTNATEMKIKFKNGSLIQVVGSDNYDSLVGTNPIGIIFSEFALQDPRAYQFLRPVLTANDGWALFISTPRGKNHFWELYQIAINNPSHWYCSKLTVEDTHHISLHDIERERQSGEMSEDLIQQEYYTSWDMGVEGSYYAKYLDSMRIKGQIGMVPYESGFKVNTAWDIGVRDSTSIIFFQVVGQIVRIIDYYENSKVGLEHYVKVLEQKDYVYGKHIAPHDIAVKEWGSGMTRIEKAKELGIRFIVAPDVSIEDGIESVRSAFSKIWIDEVRCAQLLKALGNYRQEYDSKRKVYKSTQLHDWSSHACFTGDTLILTHRGMRPIMDIKDGDIVLTLKGWKACKGSWITKKNAQLVEVRFKDGTTVRCTPDHFFLTENGWKYAENLEQGSKIQSSLMNLRSTSTDRFIDSGLEKSIFLKEGKESTGRFGKMLLGAFRITVTFIIKIMRFPITLYGILSAFLARNILKNRNQTQGDLATKQEARHLGGIHLKQEDCGTRDMRKTANLGPSGSTKQKAACIVERNTRALLERMDMNRSFAIQTAKLPIIESVNPINETADVWCLSVPDVGHFSLHNGAIVKNSDAMRYLCISLPKTRDGLSAEQLDKRYNEAMYGDRANMPSFFRDDNGMY